MILSSLLNLFGCKQIDKSEKESNKADNLIKVKSNIYKIDSTEFEFKTTGLVGVINNNKEFCWAIDLYANSGKLQGHEVSPKFSFTELKESTNYIYNEVFKWKTITPYNDETNNWTGSFYIYDSHYFTANIELIKIDSKNFKVIINGKVNLNTESYPTKNFKPFQIESYIPFNGIICEINNKTEAVKIASRFIDVQNLKWISKEENKSINNNWLR